MDLSRGDWKELPKKERQAWKEQAAKEPTDENSITDIDVENIESDSPVSSRVVAGDDSITIAIMESSKLLELVDGVPSSKGDDGTLWSPTEGSGRPSHTPETSSVILAIDRWIENRAAIRRLLPNSLGAGAAETAIPTSTDSHEAVAEKEDDAKGLRGRTVGAALVSSRSPDERLALLPRLVQVCHTLAYAHARGVVHLDLGLETVLLGELGETVVRGWCSAVVADGREKTEQGPTPRDPKPHISPERLSDSPPPADPSADIWSIGALLYHILTGRPVFDDGEPESLRQSILLEDVAAPHEIEPRIPKRLSQLCLWALRKDPLDRPGNAGDFGKELERALAESVLRAPEVPRDMGDGGKTKRIIIGAALSVIAIGIGALAVISLLAREQKQALDIARSALDHASATKARNDTPAAQPEQPSALDDDSYRTARALATRSKNSAEKRRHHRARIYAAASLSQNQAFAGSPRFDAQIAQAHPEAKELAASMVGRYHLAEAASRYERLAANDDPGDIAAWIPHPKAEAVFIGTAEGVVRRHDFGTWSTPELLGKLSSPIVALDIFPDGERLVAVSEDGKAWIWNIDDGSRKTRIFVGERRLLNAAISSDGDVLATSHENGAVKLWGSKRGRPLSDLRSHIGPVRSLTYHPRRNRLATGGSNGNIAIWQLPAERRHLLIKAHSAPIVHLEYSRDGKRLLSTSEDGTVGIWDVKKGRRLYSTKPEQEVAPIATFLPGEESLIAMSPNDGELRLFDWKGETIAGSIDISGSPKLMTRSRDGKHILLETDDGTVSIWRKKEDTLQERSISPKAKDTLHALDYSGDGSKLAAAGSNHVVRVWKIGKKSKETAFATKGEDPVEVAVSPDANHVAALTQSGTLRVWSLAPTKLVWKAKPRTKRDQGLDFHPEGKLVASGGGDGSVHLWSLEDDRPVHSSVPHTGDAATSAVAFSPEGDLLASWHEDGRIALRDPITAEKTGLIEPESPLSAFGGFSPDGRKIAAGTDAGQLVLFDVSSRSNEPSQVLPWSDTPISRVAYSEDGRYLAAASENRVAIWSTDEKDPSMIWELASTVTDLAIRPDGKALALGLGNKTTVVPLNLDAAKSDADALLSQAERAAGLNLEKLSERGNP